jgi:two-component system, LytTR family, response regulator
LKPFSFARFAQAVERARLLSDASDSRILANTGSIFVKTEQRYERIDLSDILFIEADRDYRRIHTIDRRIMTLVSFADFESSVTSSALLRVHRSYMVAIDKIDSIERDLIRIREHQIPVSETYRKRLLAAIAQRMPKRVQLG